MTITVTGVRQDEPVGESCGRGDGNTSPDAVLKGHKAAMRAERQGGGNGRVYHLSFTAKDRDGATCCGTVTTCVPRDNGPKGSCRDDGPRYDSLAPRGHGKPHHD